MSSVMIGPAELVTGLIRIFAGMVATCCVYYTQVVRDNRLGLARFPLGWFCWWFHELLVVNKLAVNVENSMGPVCVSEFLVMRSMRENANTG